MEKLNEITAYLATLGLNQHEIAKLVKWRIGENKLSTLQRKFADLQTIFNADQTVMAKMIVKNPEIFFRGTVDEATTSVQGKLKMLQEVLHADAATVKKIMLTFPAIFGLAIDGDNPRSVTQKLKVFKSTFEMDDQTMLRTLVKSPRILSLDTVSQTPTGLSAKVSTLKAVFSPDQMREVVKFNPTILSVPANAFKVRYMLAKNIEAMKAFFGSGFLINQNKIWARSCYLDYAPYNYHSGIVYFAEKSFNHRLGAKSTDLMRRHPLDAAAVDTIEQTFADKTGNPLTLDQQERAALGL